MAQATNEAQSAIDVLRAENERLTKELTKATSTADKHKSDLDALNAAHGELKKQAGDPEGHKAKAEQYLGELRTLKHKIEFSKVAKAHGAKEDAIDDLYELSKYQADKDDPDTKTFEKLLGELKQKKGYAFAEEQADTKPEAGNDRERVIAAASAFKPVPAAGRGQSHDPSKSGIKLTKEQMQDPKFMLDPRNKELIADAAKNRRFAR